MGIGEGEDGGLRGCCETCQVWVCVQGSGSLAGVAVWLSTRKGGLGASGAGEACGQARAPADDSLCHSLACFACRHCLFAASTPCTSRGHSRFITNLSATRTLRVLATILC